MVNIFGKSYYLDLDGITNKCRIEISPPKKTIKKTTKKEPLENEPPNSDLNGDGYVVNIFKYELMKLCVERVLMENDEIDESMGGFSNNSSPISFKLAFNTLIKNEIILEDDE